MSSWPSGDPVHLIDAGSGYAFHDLAWRAGERIPSFTHTFALVSCSECIDIMGGTVEGRCEECLGDRHETCRLKTAVREITFGEWVIAEEGAWQPCTCRDDGCDKARADWVRERARARKPRLDCRDE